VPLATPTLWYYCWSLSICSKSNPTQNFNQCNAGQYIQEPRSFLQYFSHFSLGDRKDI